MFVKPISKPDRYGQNKYTYYRLCESYRIGKATRHRTIISLGELSELSTDQERKLLADRIEELIKGSQSLFDSNLPDVIEQLAQFFYQTIQSNQTLKTPISDKGKKRSEPARDLRTVDLNSVQTEDVREVGAEWLCKQILDQLRLEEFLRHSLQWEEKTTQLAMIHLISKAVYPASEHKTAQWINDNSAVAELFGKDSSKISRFQLYKVSKALYSKKEDIEQYLSSKTNELFDVEDKILLFDLTNTYFEGQKSDSEKARYGRSKEKRKDAKLLSLALVINQAGFTKFSKIYQGNIADNKTLIETIGELSQHTSQSTRKPYIIIDAGIATEDNLAILRKQGYQYIAVSRSKLKEYEAIGNPVKLYDKRKKPIEVKWVSSAKPDNFLYVKSQMKKKKEESMDDQFAGRYQEMLENIAASIHKKGGVKKIEKVWERIGRLKQKYPAMNRYFDIDVQHDQGKATKILWSRKLRQDNQQAGVYFLRTNSENLDEAGIWNIYNTLRDVESSFRVLKTDLSLRPVYHQSDENSDAHIFLGVLAYAIVQTVRYQLKAQGINHDWQNIVRIMNTQKLVTATMLDKAQQKICIRTCSRPTAGAQQIYQALKLKEAPWRQKKYVVPQLQI
jgi:transposase